MGLGLGVEVEVGSRLVLGLRLGLVATCGSVST